MPARSEPANSQLFLPITVAGGPYTQVASLITDPLTYTDTTATAGTYYYVVTALVAGIETAVSNEAKAIIAVQLHTYLNFDAGSGTSAADTSGNAHTGTLVNATWAAGHLTGSAVSLNGSIAHRRVGARGRDAGGGDR